jgi:thioesterase domain-containing protein
MSQTTDLAGPTAAASDIEATLADIWRRTFGPKGQDTTANILHIQVGLKRLLRFLKQAEAALSTRIPPSAALRLGTVKAISEAIATQAWPAPSPLVLLRDGDPARCLYIISAGSGLVLELCDLATHLSFDGQIWGLQLPGLDGEVPPLSSIGEMAAHYAEHIQRMRIPGPCHLIGYSFGGIVVVELARQLMASGCTLGFVGLLDTTCHERYWPRSQWLLFAARQVLRRLLELRRLSPVAALRHFATKLAALGRHIRRRFDSAPGGPQPGQSIYYIAGLDPDFQRVRDAAIIAWESYQPTPLDCRMVMFRSALGDQHACDPVAIWRRHISRLEVVDVPGSHITMIRKPHVRDLATQISLRLHA